MIMVQAVMLGCHIPITYHLLLCDRAVWGCDKWLGPWPRLHHACHTYCSFCAPQHPMANIIKEKVFWQGRV